MWLIVKNKNRWIELQGTKELKNKICSKPKEYILYGEANNTFQRFFLHIKFLAENLKKRKDDYGKYCYDLLKRNMLHGIINQQRIVILKMLIYKNENYSLHSWITNGEDDALKKAWPK